MSGLPDAQPPGFVLGVDIDGVCCDYVGELRHIVAKHKGVPTESLTREVSWGCKEWGIDQEEFDDLHRKAVLEHDLLLNMKPHDGVADTLWRLSDAGVWIRIVTHRLYVNWGHETTASHTVRWLDEMRIPYRDLCFLAEKSSVEVDAMVEDAPHNIERLRAAGKIVIIFEQPFNRYLPGLRARNWAEVEEIVSDLVTQRTGSFPLQLPGLPSGADRLVRRKPESSSEA